MNAFMVLLISSMISTYGQEVTPDSTSLWAGTWNYIYELPHRSARQPVETTGRLILERHGKGWRGQMQDDEVPITRWRLESITVTNSQLQCVAIRPSGSEFQNRQTIKIWIDLSLEGNGFKGEYRTLQGFVGRFTGSRK